MNLIQKQRRCRGFTALGSACVFSCVCAWFSAATVDHLCVWWSQFLLLLARVVVSRWLLLMKRIRIGGSHSFLGLHHAFWSGESICLPHPLHLSWSVNRALAFRCWHQYLQVSLLRLMHSVEFWNEVWGREPWEVGRSDLEVFTKWESRPVLNGGDEGRKRSSSQDQSFPCYFQLNGSTSL